MMDFTLPETSQAVATLAADILTEPDPWKALAQAGLLDATSLSLLDLTTLLTEIGKRAPSLKAHATLLTGALPLARWGRPDMIPPDLTLAAALREPSRPEPTAPLTTVTNETITGTKVGVLHAEQASLLLVPALFTPSSMIMGRSRQILPKKTHDHGVALVDPHAAGVTLTPTPSSSGEPEYALRMEQAPIEGMLGGADRVRDLYQLATAGACALADGAVAGALALTRDHVATREQFGRPLAAFQAVSQQIADVYIASRTLHLATVAACWRLDAGLDAEDDLDVAGYWCAEQAPRAVRICHHLHGGLGMDVTYPLHRFSSLVADLVRYLGGTEYRLACLST
jgi:3-oxo-4-pregnene-20-carboxyl-CoA dehydrogenase alpha subunit